MCMNISSCHKIIHVVLIHALNRLNATCQLSDLTFQPYFSLVTKLTWSMRTLCKGFWSTVNIPLVTPLSTVKATSLNSLCTKFTCTTLEYTGRRCLYRWSSFISKVQQQHQKNIMILITPLNPSAGTHHRSWLILTDSLCYFTTRYLDCPDHVIRLTKIQ